MTIQELSMGKISKLLASGLGVSLSIVLTPIILHYIPDATPQVHDALQYILYIVLTGGAVYVAPANKP